MIFCRSLVTSTKARSDLMLDAASFSIPNAVGVRQECGANIANVID